MRPSTSRCSAVLGMRKECAPLERALTSRSERWVSGARSGGPTERRTSIAGW